MGEVKEDILENLVDLQDVLSHLAVKVDDLTKNVEKLLKLFNEAAQSFKEPEHDLQNTIKTLLDQNRIIAKGISIIEERLRTPYQQPPQMYPQYQAPPYQQAPPPTAQSRYTPFPQKMTPSIAPKNTSPISTPSQSKQPENQVKKTKPLPT